MSFTTFEDVVEHGFDYLGGNPSDVALRDCKRAALEAYRELINAHNWSSYYTHGRIITSGAFAGAAIPVITSPSPTPTPSPTTTPIEGYAYGTDGGYWVEGTGYSDVGADEDPGVTVTNASIQYQSSSGTYPFQVTLSGTTWPAWAGDGAYLRVGEVNARVAEMKSATVLTLDPMVTFDIDLPAGTPFTLYRDTYLLPEDFIAQDQALYQRNFGGMDYTHPREWLYENRYVFAAGTPQYYTITGDKQYPGRLTLKVFPWPYESKTIDFIYKRRARPLRIYRTTGGSTPALAAGGTIATTAGSNVITGTSTAFAPDMVGSVLRLANTGLCLPTSEIGKNPAAFESLITSWISATSVMTCDAPTQTLTGLAYTISDRVDIEEGAMLNAYLRCVEMHLGMVRTLKDKPSARNQYLEELNRAKAADSRSFQGRAVGIRRPLRRRLRDYPIHLGYTD